MRIIDSHIHLYGLEKDLKAALASNEEIRIKANMESVNVLSLSAMEPEFAYQNVLCMLFKALYPHNSAHFGFDYYLKGQDMSPDGRLSQVKEYLAMGYDGMKIIESKPSVRKVLGRSFLGEEFAKAFEHLEENNVPILWHVADPEENWDKSKCTDFAIEAGWCYDSPDYLSKEEHIAEATQMLDRHPKLNVTFAHFMFTSFNIDFAEQMMEKYPNICFDVTPGIEMYLGFDSNWEKWRNFFIKHQDRIIFGTDNGYGDDSPPDKISFGMSNIAFIKGFLCTRETVAGYNEVPVRGFGLPPEVTDKILHTNYRTKKTKMPKKLDMARIINCGKNMLDKVESTDLPANVKTRSKEVYQMLKELG